MYLKDSVIPYILDLGNSVRKDDLPALAYDNMVSFLNTEAGRDVRWYIRVSLLIPRKK